MRNVDHKKIEELGKTTDLNKLFKKIYFTKGKDKVFYFKLYAREVINLYKENRLTKEEIAYMIAGTLQYDELREEKVLNDLLETAADLEYSSNGADINGNEITLETYLKEWNTWKDRLEEFISKKFDLELDEKQLKRVLDHYSLGNIKSFSQDILELYEGKTLVPYYIVKTTQGDFLVFQCWWMEMDSEEFNQKIKEKFGNTEKLYYINQMKEKESKNSVVHLRERYFLVYKPIS